MKLSLRSKVAINSSLAISLAFAFPLFAGLSLPAYANATPLEIAQANLAAGQQEVIDARAALDSASAAVQAASESLAVAQSAYDNPSNSSTVASTVQTSTQNVVQNGTFDDASAWSGITLYQESMFNNFGSAVVKDGTLVGSYSSGNFYLQTGNFSSPTRNVTFSVDVFNNNNNNNNALDYYRIEFRTYAADGTRLNYFNLQYSGAFHGWQTYTSTPTLAQDAVRWDIGFRLQDGGYWNGNYGPAIDNVVLNAQVTTGTPEHTVVDPTVVQALLTAAQAYDQSTVELTLAQQRYDNAVAAIPALEAAVVDATPAPTPWWQLEWYENQDVGISIVSEGYVFSSVTAWYGGSNGVCGATVSAVLEPLFLGQTSVSFIANNSLLGDPCPGTPKVLRLALELEPTSNPTQPASPTPTPEPTPAPTSEPTPEPSSPEPTPTQPSEPTPEPTQEPTPTPEPTPQPTPEPTQTPQPEPEPTLTPSPEPTPTPTPTPTPEPTQTPKPTPSPSVEPIPTPTPTTPQPSPTPTPSETPSPTPTPEPTKEPTPTEEPVVVEIAEPITAENIEALVEELTTVAPQDLTQEQQALIVEAALEVFASAEQGSPEYEAALDALLVVAQADDIVVDEELAAVPVVGAAVVALADAFNALGNAGADMSPQVREQSEKVVIAAVIVGQVAMTATAAATSAAASAARTK